MKLAEEITTMQNRNTDTELVTRALRAYADHVQNGGAWDEDSWIDLSNHAADLLDPDIGEVERKDSREYLATFCD
jgi:hypothetical protein